MWMMLISLGSAEDADSTIIVEETVAATKASTKIVVDETVVQTATLGEILHQQSSVQMRELGGVGRNATISIRGTSSRQNLVLLNL